jgi:hypothetical protein
MIYLIPPASPEALTIGMIYFFSTTVIYGILLILAIRDINKKRKELKDDNKTEDGFKIPEIEENTEEPPEL